MAVSRRVLRSPSGLAKAIFSLTFLVLVLGACSSDGFPTSYADQPQTLEDGTQVSLVQRNWLEGCTVSFAESDLADDANAICECSYSSLSAPASEGGLPFEDFVALNDELKGNPESLSTSDGQTLSPNETALALIVQSCICDLAPGKTVEEACGRVRSS